MLEKYFKGFPEKQALKSTVATMFAYKGSKYFSNMMAERLTENAPSNKKPLYEFLMATGATLGSIYAYTKMKSKDIGFGLVLGSGLNTADKFFLLPSIKKAIPEKMQPLFAGENDVDITTYDRRVNDARYTLDESDVKDIVNAAKVNGWLNGFEDDNQEVGDLGSDVIVITPEERAALLDSKLSGSSYDPKLEEFERPSGFGSSEEEMDGDEEMMGGDEEFA
jgi:hypothetical protein